MVEAKTGEKYLGKIASDDSLADSVMCGESLLKLAKGSAASLSAEEIFLKTGY